jgi:hypothetical protein
MIPTQQCILVHHSLQEEQQRDQCCTQRKVFVGESVIEDDALTSMQVRTGSLHRI